MTNSADPDQLASSEANWSGSTLFTKAWYIRVQQGKGWFKQTSQITSELAPYAAERRTKNGSLIGRRSWRRPGGTSGHLL